MNHRQSPGSRSQRAPRAGHGRGASHIQHASRQERLAWGPAHEDGGLFFARENGTILHPDAVSKTFDRLVRRSGLARIRLHDLRHTFATLALSTNLHPKAVRRSWDPSVSMTLDIYTHASPSMQEEAVTRVAGIIFGIESGR